MLPILGYKPSDLLDKSLYECHHSVDSEALMAAFKNGEWLRFDRYIYTHNIYLFLLICSNPIRKHLDSMFHSPFRKLKLLEMFLDKHICFEINVTLAIPKALIRTRYLRLLLILHTLLLLLLLCGAVLFTSTQWFDSTVSLVHFV